MLCGFHPSGIVWQKTGSLQIKTGKKLSIYFINGEIGMIRITMNNGIFDEWKPEQYTDYIYDGKCFIIIKGEQ